MSLARQPIEGAWRLAARVEQHRVVVRDLAVLADIGVREHEVGNPQLLLIEARLDVRVPRADRLEETFDYCRLAALAQALGRERIGLVETFARRLAEACLEHPLVERADIRIDKPAALRSGVAGVQIVMGRARPGGASRSG